MARGDSSRLSPGEGRRFGYVVGTAFLGLAAFGWWQGHAIIGYTAGTLGVFLLAAGLGIPERLGPVQRAWYRLAESIARVTTPVVLAIIYFLVLTPVGFLRRKIGGDPMNHDLIDGSYWIPCEESSQTDMHHQF